MSQQTQALRALIAGGEPFIAADCYSALTARIIQHVGFSAGYMGGHATGMMHYAIPDNGALTPTEMIDQAARVTEAVDIPIIVDADQAGESIADVHRTIPRYERVGVAGVDMEDEITPKHSTFDGPLMSTVDMQARITAAVDARRDPDFLIIARCDEFYSVGGGGSGSLEEAIRRGSPTPRPGGRVPADDGHRRSDRRDRGRCPSPSPASGSWPTAWRSACSPGGVPRRPPGPTTSGPPTCWSTVSCRPRRSGSPTRTSSSANPSTTR